MRFAKYWPALPLCVIILTSCGGGGDNSQTTIPIGGAPTPTPTPGPANIGQAVEAALARGSLPALNTDASVAGPDSNGNGIRDDIDAYIGSLADTDIQKTALRQHAATVQASLTIDTSSASIVSAQTRKIVAASQCLFSKYPAIDAAQKGETIQKYTVNTKARFLAYAKFSDAASGSVLLSQEGSGCD